MGMIKFRGVNIFGNEWLYGNLVKIEENRYSILPEINDRSEEHTSELQSH